MKHQLNTEQRLDQLRKTTRTAIGFHVALLGLEVAVIASALPYVYSPDAPQSCGARFLVHYTFGNIQTSALTAFVLVYIPRIYAVLFEQVLNSFRVLELALEDDKIISVVFNAPAAIAILVFLVVTVGQIATLRNPPPLPFNVHDMNACNAMAETFTM
jgi:hypothetical protein